MTMKNNLTHVTPPPYGDEPDNGTLNVQLKLWDFIGKQVERFTSGDSSSVPVEMAQELFASVCYTLGIDIAGNPDDLAWILDADLDQKFRDGTEDLKRKLKIGKRLWQAACLGVPKIHNESMHDTLRSMSGFFRHYDPYYFAHDIPCDIDYQLCRPVSERLLGVDFVNEYLKRIVIENELLSCFSPSRCTSLLNVFCPDYEGLLINLYEPVATNVIGLSLIGGDIRSLNISEFDRWRISGLLGPLPEEQVIEALKHAASLACDTLGITKLPSRHYLRKFAAALYPRLDAALSAGNLDGIFLDMT